MKFLLTFKVLALMTTTTAFSLTSLANAKDFSQEFFEVEVEEIATSDQLIDDYLDDFNYFYDSKNLGQAIREVRALIALGKEVWEIVEAGRPVLNSSYMSPISVLPRSEDPALTFYDMSGWQAPKARTYRVTYRNVYGMRIATFEYTIAFQYGGSYQGKGAYLTGVDVFARNVWVAWGFELNAHSELLTITNRGTDDNPVAGATVRISHSLSSVMTKTQRSSTFHVSGNGEIVAY